VGVVEDGNQLFFGKGKKNGSKRLDDQGNSTAGSGSEVGGGAQIMTRSEYHKENRAPRSREKLFSEGCF